MSHSSSCFTVIHCFIPTFSSRFYECIVPILQDSRYKMMEDNRQELVFALRCVWKMLPHLGHPGKVVLAMLQRCVLGVGASVSSQQVNREVLNVMFVLWPKWGVQTSEDSMVENLGRILCLTFRSEPYSNLQTAGKLVQAVVKTIFVRLERKDLARLESTGVHKCFRQLLLHYEAFNWRQFQAIILGCGLMEDIVNRSNDYLQEGVIEMLLFAAKEFANEDKSEDTNEGKSDNNQKTKIQWDIWTLLSLLCRQNRDISSGLHMSGALDVVVSVLSSPSVERAPIYQFVASLMSGNPAVKASIVQDSTILADVNSTLIEGMKSPFIDHNAITAGDFFASLTDKVSYQISRSIVQQQLLRPLLQGAKQHPQFLAERALQCVKNLAVIGSSRQEGSARDNPGSALDLPKVEKELAEGSSGDTIFDVTYKEGYHTFLQSLLESVSLSDTKLITLLYQTLTSFTFHCPLKISHVILSEEFLSALVQASNRHLSQFQDVSVLSALASAISSVTFNCLTHPQATQRLQNAGMHNLVVRCLTNLPHASTLLKWLMTFSNLVYCYRIHLKDMKCMFECDAHKVLVSTAMEYGMNTAIGDELDRCLLNWTYDKESSDRFGKENFTVTLMPLLEHQYAPSLRRAVIHAIGNIAISGQKTKLALLDRGIHIILLEHIRDRIANSESPSYLSACCRLLHIVSSSDNAKVLLLDQNCLKLMMELIQSYPGRGELEWRPLGTISAVCFLPVACRHHIYSQELLQFLSLLLRSSNQAKVIAYVALVLLAIAEDDEGLVQVARLDLEEKLRSAVNNPDYIAVFSDLRRWGSIVLEKLQLHAIKLPQSLFKSLEVPPLPNLGSGCTGVLSDCQGKVSQTNGKYNGYVPQGPKMTNVACEQLLALGRNPYQIFRVGRMFGSTNGLCSNCEKDDSSSELVFRPHSLSPAHYQELISMGWYRRGGVKMFRFHDVHGIECCDWETRVIAEKFSVKSHKSFMKTIRRMPKDLEIRKRPAYFNREAFDLYNTYHLERYDKPPKSEHSYIEHVVNSPVQHKDGRYTTMGTFHEEYYLDGKLVAVSVLDVVPKGMVSIYMWYDLRKEISKYSFGVYSALKEIESIQERQKTDPDAEFYYMQGWNEHNRRLKYKGDYEPEEFYAPCITDHWVSSKDGVNEEKKRVLKESESQHHPQHHLPDNGVGETGVWNDLSTPAPMDTSSSAQKTKEKKPHFRSINNDRAAYAREIGVPRVDDLVLCLNQQKYITFGELKTKFPLNELQKELMEKRFEEYILAVGGTLSSQMVVDLLVIPY